MTLTVDDIHAIALEVARVNGEQLLRDIEVAEMLGIGQSTVWLYVKQQRIPSPVMIGKNTRWKRSQIREFIESLEVAA